MYLGALKVPGSLGHAINVDEDLWTEFTLLEIERLIWWIHLAPGAYSHHHMLKSVRSYQRSPRCPCGHPTRNWSAVPWANKLWASRGHHLARWVKDSSNGRSHARDWLLTCQRKRWKLHFSLSPFTGKREKQIKLSYKSISKLWEP